MRVRVEVAWTTITDQTETVLKQRTQSESAAAAAVAEMIVERVKREREMTDDATVEQVTFVVAR